MKKSKISLLVVMVFYFSLFGTNTLAVGAPNPPIPIADDSILSQHIKEADGTTGQDTNTGSGIKTGHIQDGAVTTGKIVDNSITTNKISDGSVTTPKLGIVCPDGQYLQYTVLSGWVCSVGTPGPKGDTGATGPQGTAGPQCPVGSTPHYAKVAVVAQASGDYTDPLSAMNDLATWCGTPSATNRCLLKIMPGIYNLGGGSIETRQYVDVEGSGENVTLIKSNALVVSCSDNVEVRFLTVESTGGTSISNAISVAGSAKLTHVTAKASDGVDHNIGIWILSGSPFITDVTVELQDDFAKNWGIYVDTIGNTVVMSNVMITVGNGHFNYAIGIFNGKAVMNNVTTTVYGGPNSYPGTNSYGIWNQGGAMSITNSYISGKSFGLSTSGPTSIQNSTIKGGDYSLWATSAVDCRMAVSQIDGPFYPATTGLKCFNVYDANFLPIACP